MHGARRRAESADIVVTNHSLLVCDLAADGGLLPPIRYWVVDEAHGAEVEARRAFSLALSAEDILRLTTRVSAEETSRNVFLRAERRVVAPENGEGAVLFLSLIHISFWSFPKKPSNCCSRRRSRQATHAQSCPSLLRKGD